MFTVLSQMDDASAEATLRGFSHVLNRIEAQQRLSLTYDQGREMATHQQLTEATGVKVFFADPRKSLGFRCPAELFTPDAFNFRQHHAALFALGH